MQYFWDEIERLKEEVTRIRSQLRSMSEQKEAKGTGVFQGNVYEFYRKRGAATRKDVPEAIEFPSRTEGGALSLDKHGEYHYGFYDSKLYPDGQIRRVRKKSK